MGASENRGTPKSSILMRFSIIFAIHFGVSIVFGNTHIYTVLAINLVRINSIKALVSWQICYDFPCLRYLQKPLVDFFEMKPAKKNNPEHLNTVSTLEHVIILRVNYCVFLGPSWSISFPTIVEGVEQLHQLPQKRHISARLKC